MTFNEIFILGAGAIGSSYGALLSKNNNVTLIGNKAHVDTINSKGLLVSGDIQERFFIKADTKIREIKENTLIILATKAYDSTAAINGIKELLKKDTTILVLQNGLGNEELVKEVVSDEVEVVRGLTSAGAEFLEPGKVTFRNGETILEHTATGEKIAKVFNESKLKTRLSNEMRKEIWNKLVINCVVNPLTAILQTRDDMIIVKTLEAVRRQIIKECVEVGKAEGITFEHNLEKIIDEKISRFTNFSSMYQDIVKGKKTEIDFLNGKIVELGRKHGIPTPINETLVCLVKFLEGENVV